MFSSKYGKCQSGSISATPSAEMNSVEMTFAIAMIPSGQLVSVAARTTVQVGHAEGQVEGLAAVEPGIARRLVAVAQVALGDVVAAADALGDVVAGELDVDAAGMGAERPVHLEEARSE